MDEFDFIRQILTPLAGPEGLRLGDDAALFTPAAGHDLVITKDAMVEGVHFPTGHYGGDVAEKLLRVNLSDLAAKGAQPLGYLLSLTIPPPVNELHLRGFAGGLRDVQQAYDFTLWGGDTISTSGPFVVSATFIGQVPSGKMVKRSGAQIGDDVWVSGSIGDAYLGLQNVLGHKLSPKPASTQIWHWEEAYLRPEPRLLMRKLLRHYASAALDISDGFLADAAHLARASGVGVRLSIEDVPLSKATLIWLEGQADILQGYERLLSGGDDYELLFTAHPKYANALSEQAKSLGQNIHKVGEIIKTDKPSVTSYFHGDAVTFKKTGYKHQI